MNYPLRLDLARSKALNRTMQILLVEDDESIREVFKLILEIEAPFPNMKVSAVASGGEAMSFIQQNGKPDLILLDLTLPEGHGFDVFREIRKVRYCDSIAVIAVTAHNLTELREEALKMGFAGYITKPIDFEGSLLPLMRKLFPNLPLKRSSAA